MKKLLYMVLLGSLLLAACQRTNTATLLHRADAIVKENPDSAMKLLSSIKDASRLPYEEQMLYGWLRTYVHYRWNFATIEDSLILPAHNYYIAQKDTDKMLLSYVLKADYLTWHEQHKQALAALDSAIAVATLRRDTSEMVSLYGKKANKYVYIWKDYGKSVEELRKAVALREDDGLCFTLGISMGLNGDDSATYYMDRSIEMALDKKDTIMAAHFLRNYAQLLAYGNYSDYRRSVAIIKRLEELTTDAKQRSMGYLALTEAYLKLGQMDSAAYYLAKGEEELTAANMHSLTPTNMVSHYHALIDYSRNRTFNILHVMRYNDSIWNAMWSHHQTTTRKEESKTYLTQANLQLTVERQRTQLLLLLLALALVVVGGGGFFYFYRRRNRLIEAEERVETLNRLLVDATKEVSPKKPDNEEESEKGMEVEDGQFFKKLLLQQLGIIRLVATQPTSQNQELLRRISGITNNELPVESLLVWEDLYPVIDRVYDGFYTKMNQSFGFLLADKEQQLCCLLCAEFATKEISVVMQQSIPTIYQRKTTIRKKLGMGEKEDIIEFILLNEFQQPLATVGKETMQHTYLN